MRERIFLKTANPSQKRKFQDKITLKNIPIQFFPKSDWVAEENHHGSMSH
jgi:hypothetical protein